MAKLFTDLLVRATRSGLSTETIQSKEWYRNKAKSMGRQEGYRLLREAPKDRLKNPQNFQIGSMYMFGYDPKHKETLPYYDRFPLIFPIGIAKKGWLGINFHYLPYTLRAKLMDALYDTISNNRYDESTKLKLSYGILKSASKYSLFKPCIKHYLFKHVKSRLLYIHPSEWDSALFLQVESFEKARSATVWKNSKALIG